MDTQEYWSEKAVYIYGLLAGFTKLSHQKLEANIIGFVNKRSNIIESLAIMKTLEIERLVYFYDITIKLWAYNAQVHEEFEETAARISDSIEDSLPYNFLEKELDLNSITEVVSHKGLVTEALHDCLSFNIHINDLDKLNGIFGDYLNKYKANKLYSSNGGYAPYIEQRSSVLRWIDGHKTTDPMYRIGLSQTTRLLETAFALSSEGQLTIETPTDNDLDSPAFGLMVKSGSNIRVVHPTYDAKKRKLIFIGNTIYIPADSDQEILCKSLFKSAKSINDGVEKGDLFEAFGYDPFNISPKTKDKARRKIYSAKDALNDRVSKETTQHVKDLFIVKKKFLINPEYL